MKKLAIFFLLSVFSYAQQPVLPIEFFSMTTGAILMPTILPTYVTIQHFNPPPHLKHREKIKKFISENFESLKEQIAKGGGEHLDTLAVLYKLKEVNLWKEHLQNKFEEIYQEDRDQKAIFNYIDALTYREFIPIKVYTAERYNATITPIHLP